MLDKRKTEVKEIGRKKYSQFEKKLDSFIVKSKFTIPLFFVLLLIIFELTFSVGNFFANLVDTWGSFLFHLTGIENRFINAVFWGIMGVLIYIPNVFILYFFLYLLQDSGILPRISFVFDKILKKLGLSWDGFLSMFLGFWCTIPAILSTKTVEDRKERVLTIMMLPFISCSAKLPVFVLLISAFIPAYLQSLSLISVYVFGICMWVFSNWILVFFLKHKKHKFRTHLPNYRIPRLGMILKQIYGVLKDFLRKITLFILPFSVFLTLIFSYPSTEDINNTYGAKVGKAIGIIFEPIGFNDKMSISVISGLVGKEIVVSTLGSLYYLEDTSNTDRLIEKMRKDTTITFPWVISFLIFILLYTPCLWALFTVRMELWNYWAVFFLLYPTIFAWIISFLVYNLLVFFSNFLWFLW